MILTATSSVALATWTTRCSGSMTDGHRHALRGRLTNERLGTRTLRGHGNHAHRLHMAVRHGFQLVHTGIGEIFLKLRP